MHFPRSGLQGVALACSLAASGCASSNSSGTASAASSAPVSSATPAATASSSGQAREATPAPGMKAGDKAPAFRLQGSDGKEHALSDHSGRQVVVLAWFPKAFTAG